MSFSAEALIEVVNRMYSPTGGQNYSDLDSYLKSFQQSNEAWGIIDQIFATPNLPEQIYLFIGVTLKTKLSFDFSELSGVDFLGFKNNLLSLCQKFSSEKLIMRQLAQSVSVLGFHLVESWKFSMFNEIYEAFKEHSAVLLEIFKCFAEEACKEAIVVDEDLFKQFKALLSESSEHVILYLESVCAEETILVLETFLAWVELGLDPKIIVNLPNSPLLLLCFQSLSLPEYFETSCGIICELIRATEDYEKYQGVVRIIVENVMQLKEEALRSLQEDGETCEEFIKIFTILGRKHVDILVKEEAFDLLDTLQQLYMTNNLSSMKEISDFWYRFFYKISNLEDPERTQKKESFAEIINKFLGICLVKCKLSYENLQKTEPLDVELEEKRGTYASTLMDIGYTIDSLGPYRLLTQNLEQLIQGVIEIEPQEKLAQIETIIKCLSYFCDVVDDGEEIERCVVISVSQTWPLYELNLSACTLLKHAASSIRSENIPLVLNYLSNCLKDPNMYKPCIVALREICVENYKSLAGHENYLFEIFGIASEIPFAIREYLIEGVSYVIWRSTNYIQVTSLMNPYISELEVLCREENLDVEKTGELLDCVSIIFKTGESSSVPETTYFEIFNHLWPLMKGLFNVFQTVSVIIERLSLIIKYTLRNCNDLFADCLSDLSAIIMTLTPIQIHSSFYYICESLVKIFTPYAEYHEILSILFNHLTEAALRNLTDFNEINNNPELTEDFFGMAIRYLTYAPSLIVNSPHLEEIIQTAQKGIGLNHRESAKCIYLFLEMIAQMADPYNSHNIPELENLFEVHFKEILIMLFQAIVDIPINAVYHMITDLVYRVILTNEDVNWVSEAVGQIPHDCLTESEKEKFVNSKKTPSECFEWMEKFMKRAKAKALRNR